MGDLLGTAVAWLDAQRTEHLSRQVVYQRGAYVVEIAAMLGSTPYEVIDDTGAAVQAKITDFVVSAGSLVLSGHVVKPQPGDRIRLPQGGKVLVFEVMDLGKGRHCVPADPFGTALRIHAKQIGEEPG